MRANQPRSLLDRLNLRQHVWYPGRWEVRRSGYEYIGPRWIVVRGRHEYIPGHWVRVYR